MSTETNGLATRGQSMPAPFEPENLPQAIELCQRLAKSALLPTALRGKPEDVMVVLMTGRELGLSPMQSIRGISVIEGKGALNADLIVGLVQSRPTVCEYFQLISSSDAEATYETKRRGHKPTRLQFTMTQAKAAGIAGKQNWSRWPAAMLRARCSAHLARAVYPDLVAGIYSTDEADEIRTDSRPAREALAQLASLPDAPRETITGEVVPSPAAEPWAEEPAAPAAPQEPDLAARVAAAPNLDALKALASELGRVPDGPTKDALRAAYGARRDALRQAPTAASAPAVGVAP